jgi:hypothetical protein
VGKPEGKRPLGIPRIRSEGDIEVDLQEVGWGHGLEHGTDRLSRNLGIIIDLFCATSNKIEDLTLLNVIFLLFYYSTRV